MHNHAARLSKERDSFTQMASDLVERADGEQRDLTDAEQETLRGWSERCATIDRELERTREQMASTRAWSQLRSALGDLDSDPPGEHPNGNSGNGRRSTALAVPSWGQAFVESDQFRSWHGGRGAPVTMPTGLLERAAQAAPTAGPRAASDCIQTGDLLDHAVEYFPREPTWTNPLLGVVSREPVSAGSVEWIRFQPDVPAAAPVVPEGALKPPLDITLTEKSVTLNTFAVWKCITRQALEDGPRVRAIVEGYLRQALLRALENAIAAAITGDTDIGSVGTAPTTGDNAAAGTPLLVSIRAAMAQVEANGFTPNTVLINSADWAAMDVAAAILASALPGVQRGFWGLTVVGSPDVAAGTAYVGDLRAGVTLFDRNATAVYISDSHADMFLRNVLVILAETRAYAAVVNPGAICKAVGDGSACVECVDGSIAMPTMGELLSRRTTVTTTTTTTTEGAGAPITTTRPGDQPPPQR